MLFDLSITLLLYLFMLILLDLECKIRHQMHMSFRDKLFWLCDQSKVGHSILLLQLIPPFTLLFYLYILSLSNFECKMRYKVLFWTVICHYSVKYVFISITYFCESVPWSQEGHRNIPQAFVTQIVPWHLWFEKSYL
jgi:hypothetical protein